MNETHDQDFSTLRNLLTLSKNDYPQDTQVEEFLTEFHRRQRAEHFVRKSLFSSAVTWAKARIAGFDLVPSLSYAGVAAAIALTAVIGLSQQVAVTTNSDGQTKFSLRMPGTHEGSYAMLPGTLLPSATVSPKLTDATNFTPSRTDAAATRYVLANTTPGANDASVAF
jgi:hypothetical protein